MKIAENNPELNSKPPETRAALGRASKPWPGATGKVAADVRRRIERRSIAWKSSASSRRRLPSPGLCQRPWPCPGRLAQPALLIGCALSVPARAGEISFRNDVIAVISKAGCNAGTCHGNRAGKAGLKLSLRGEDSG